MIALMVSPMVTVCVIIFHFFICVQDVTYYVYVEAFNMQGYSGARLSTPTCATPSSKLSLTSWSRPADVAQAGYRRPLRLQVPS